MGFVSSLSGRQRRGANNGCECHKGLSALMGSPSMGYVNSVGQQHQGVIMVVRCHKGLSALMGHIHGLISTV
jgi:hypothetical protein